MISEYVPLHVHSDSSLLDGRSLPDQLAERCVTADVKACALTDHGSLAGIPSFLSEFKKLQKKNDKTIKPILGCEFYVAPHGAALKVDTNRKNHHLCVLAKNLEGWKTLVKLSSQSNLPENFYFKPRTDIETIANINSRKNLIAFSGHPGSTLANVLFSNQNAAYDSENIYQAKSALHPDWMKLAVETAGKHVDAFGIDNFYIEIQIFDYERMPASLVIADCLRQVAKNLNLRCIYTTDAHYASQADAIDQRVLLCSALKTTTQRAESQIKAGEFFFEGFFNSDKYYIHSKEDVYDFYKKSESIDHYYEETANTLRVAEQIENFDIFGKPLLPKYVDDSAKMLDHLCRDGLKRKVEPYGDTAPYIKRLEYELHVLNNAGLADYFLIVQDIIKDVYSRGKVTGVARGSAGGCLVSYLTDIIKVDPLQYDLLFDRFYNAGRNTASNVALPDIDVDFMREDRENVIKYIKNKYGEDRVAHIATYGRLMGRSALKEVMRIHEAAAFEEINEITKHIPNEAEIADDLQQMEESGELSSIILWSLVNTAALRQYCTLTGRPVVGQYVLEGPYAKYFDQAIRLEGVRKSMSKHASGIIVCSQNIDEIAPLARDKEGEKMVAFEGSDAEKVGLVKLDILGTAILDKMHGACETVES